MIRWPTVLKVEDRLTFSIASVGHRYQERAAQMSPSHQTTNNNKTIRERRMNKEMRRRAIKPVNGQVKTEGSSSQDMTKVNNLRSNPYTSDATTGLSQAASNPSLPDW